MVDWDGWLHVSWTQWQHLDWLLMDMVFVTSMEFLTRRLGTAGR